MSKKYPAPGLRTLTLAAWQMLSNSIYIFILYTNGVRVDLLLNAYLETVPALSVSFAEPFYGLIRSVPVAAMLISQFFFAFKCAV